jgi:hypothetical protein
MSRWRTIVAPIVLLALLGLHLLHISKPAACAAITTLPSIVDSTFEPQDLSKIHPGMPLLKDTGILVYYLSFLNPSTLFELGWVS